MNLLEHIELAGRHDDTERLVNAMKKNPGDGGVLLAGGLSSHEIIHVATAVHAIANEFHAQHVKISTGTKTCQRLKDFYQIHTEQQRVELMAFISQSDEFAGLSGEVRENALCESLRWKHGNRDFYDTVGERIYTMDGGSLRAYDLSGNAVEVGVPEWHYPLNDAERCARDWVFSSTAMKPSGRDRLVMLTTNGKRKQSS